MTKQWTAELSVEPELAKRLIESQFPALTPVSLKLIGEGWDNIVYRVNNDYAFRFPRRQIAVALLETEGRVLPHLVPRLPLSIPEPLFFGQPGPEFPWQFLGYRFVEGQTACKARLSLEERARLAVPLAHFLKALHAIPVGQATEFGVRPDMSPGPSGLKRCDIQGRWPIAFENVKKIQALGLFAQCDKLFALLESLKNVKEYGPHRLVHGDLYARHLLVNHERELCGVIDWGDVHVGPAIDLQIVYSFLPRSAHRDFFDVYGPIDEGTRQVALFRAIYHTTLTNVLYGHDVGDKDLLDEGLLGLRLMVGE